MKKFLLLSLGYILASISVLAEEVVTNTISVTFSEFIAGSQYADNEKHEMGGGLTIYTTDCHFTTELRIYSSTTYNGFVVSDPLPGVITSMSFNAGYNKEEELNVYGSTDGYEWTLVGKITTATTSYKDYTLIFSKGNYTRFKLDVAGENQIRIAKMSVTYKVPDSYVASPSLPESCEFMGSKEVTITNNASGSTVYYTTDGTEPSASSMEYTLPFTITETTTVKAVAVKDVKASDVVEATYTEFIPECILPGVSPVGGDSEATAVMIKQHSKITIIPAKFNEVTYSLNGSATTVITEKEDIVIENAGKLALTITSAAADETESVIYYYDVVEAFPEITAALTSDDIKNKKKDTGEAYAKDNVVESSCGDWTGYFASVQKTGRVWLKNEDNIHLQSPDFPGKVSSVSITFSADNTEGRGFVIKSTDDTEDVLGSGTYKGTGSPTSTVAFSKDVTSFKVYATGSTIYISKIEVVYEKPADYVLEVGPSGWATIYLGLDAAILDGLKCYAISSVTDNIAILSSLTNTLPAHSGVIVKGIPNTNYTFAYNNNYAGNADVENLLRGTLSNEYLSSPIFVLSNPNDVVGLYSAKEVDGKFLNNANKAYLPADAVPAASLSQGLRFSSQDPTSIIETERSITPSGDAVIYDLTGRRVERMGKGIYIVNGKKVINN